MSRVNDVCMTLKHFVLEEILLQKALRVSREFLLQRSCFEVITREWVNE